MRNLRRGGSPSPFIATVLKSKSGIIQDITGIASASKREVSKQPLWYVFIDESGNVKIDTDKSVDGEYFAMDAVVTQDPEALAQIILRMRPNSKGKKRPDGTYYRDKGKEPGSTEIKYRQIHPDDVEKILSELDKGDYRCFGNVNRIAYSAHTSNGDKQYLAAFTALIETIAEYGPDGLYRIRIDHSDHFDKEKFEAMARKAFSEFDGKELTREIPILSVDSVITPAIQTVDVLVGRHRASARSTDSEALERFEKHLINPKRGVMIADSWTREDKIKARKAQGSENPGPSKLESRSRMNAISTSTPVETGQIRPFGVSRSRVLIRSNRTGNGASRWKRKHSDDI